MNPRDTIAAIASPPGRGAVAVLRLSGPGTGAALAALGIADDDAPSPGAPGVSRCVTLAIARDASSGDPIPPTLPVPATLIRWWAPRSYTGEDGAELIVPGHPALVARVLRALCAGHARPATPGEFTARAFLSGRLTLDQAEGVGATIAARTEAELTAARRLLAGHAGGRFRAWADELTTLLALVEAGIDFTDQEDVVAIAPPDLAARLDTVRADVRAHAGADPSAPDRDAVRVVLFGRPNAGKSALFNALLGRRRVIVSDIAGATRDAIVEALGLTLGGATRRVLLVDLPGVFDPHAGSTEGAAQTEADRAAIGRARDEMADADIVLHCDPRARFEVPDGTDWPAPGAGVIRVRTMADRPGIVEHTDRPRFPEPIAVSVLDGRGLDALRDAIAGRAARVRGLDPLVPVRHAEALGRAGDWLDRAHGFAGTAGDELVAEAIRGALDELGRLIGRVHADDVIGRVFATFCVGK